VESREKDVQSGPGVYKHLPVAAKHHDAPMVSVLLPTFNRPKYLAQALASAVNQTYRNLQVIVVNDGGEDVSDVIGSFNDPRVLFIDRKENHGKAFSLNQALAGAEGKYIAYLDDDDLYYPNHIETLVDALEEKPQCGAAYSDLYNAHCELAPDGSRIILSKVVEVSRDFDRFLVLYFNNVLHVSLMHRKDLLERTGPYNETLDVLIDWDMTRKLAFFTDFCHLCQITGQYHTTPGRSDRISVRQRKDKRKYLGDALKIRTTRPPKPWLKIRDLSIIFTAAQPTRQTIETLALIWRYTFYPYKLYLPMPQTQLDSLQTQMPNIVPIPVQPKACEAERIDAALAKCDGEYVAVVPAGFEIRDFWLEDSLYGLINSQGCRDAYELEASSDALWAVVLEKSDLMRARSSFSHLPLRQSLEAANIRLRRLCPEEIPFQFDQLLEQARRTQKDGNYAKAAVMFQYIAEHYQNELWMKTLATEAFFKAANLTKAAELACELNRQRPTVDTLLLEARIKRQEKNFSEAIQLLEKAKQFIEARELIWT